MLRDFFIAYHACIQSLSHVQLFATPWTVAHQNPMSMEFSRQEYWSGLPFPSPGDFPDPGIEPGSPELPADSLPSEPPGKPLTKFLVANSKKSLWFNAAVPGYAPPHLCSSFWLLGCGHAKGRRKARRVSCAPFPPPLHFQFFFHLLIPSLWPVLAREHLACNAA